MPYSAEISRSNPSCFLFLVDQSGSMSDPFGGAGGRRKADSVSDAINRLLQNLVIKCSKGEGVRNYYDIGVIGYGSFVGPAFSGTLSGKTLVPIGEVANAPARVEPRTKKVDDGLGGLVDQEVKFPVWFDAVANGGTPMAGAFQLAHQLLQDWTGQHQSSFPPIVINITDGESNEDPSPAAQALTSLSTNDGSVLLFNCHISDKQASSVVFPDKESALPDEFARSLYNISSLLPEGVRNAASAEGFAVSPQSRGFAFNADLVELIRFLDIGTRPSNMR